MSNVIKPQGKYIPASRAGALIYTAGMTPRVNGELIMVGKIDPAQPLETYKEAVRQSVANALSAAKGALAEGEELEKIVNMLVFLNTEEGFTAHAKIADFASEYLVEELGDAGVGSRTAIGVKTLPGNCPCEIQLIAMAK